MASTELREDLEDWVYNLINFEIEKKLLELQAEIERLQGENTELKAHVNEVESLYDEAQSCFDTDGYEDSEGQPLIYLSTIQTYFEEMGDMEQSLTQHNNKIAVDALEGFAKWMVGNSEITTWDKLNAGEFALQYTQTLKDNNNE